MIYPLGDPHNGGKRVLRIAENCIYKPRTIFWEWLLLNVKSHFSQFLFSLAPHLHNSWHDIIPPLSYHPYDSLYSKGCVDQLHSLEIMKPITDLDTWQSMGIITGILAILGISDLHKENIIFGSNQNNLIFGPIDIECIFSQHTLLSQTHLLPSKMISDEDCGLSGMKKAFNLAPSIKTLTALVSGYMESFQYASSLRKGMWEYLNSVEHLSNVPIRVIPRTTTYYKKLLAEKTLSKPQNILLAEAEHEQLERGDIPYFFRFPHESKIYYFDINKNTAVTANLAPALSEDLQKSMIVFAQNEAHMPAFDSTLLKAGAMQLIHYFANKHLQGNELYANTSLILSEKVIIVKHLEMNLKCNRAR